MVLSRVLTKCNGASAKFDMSNRRGLTLRDVEQGVHLVWFKRDLRVSDHEPLLGAVQDAKRLGNVVIAVSFVEKAWIESPEFDSRHLRFALESLDDLWAELKSLNIPLVLGFGDAAEILKWCLSGNFPFQSVHSHVEVGQDWSYRRDLAIKRTLKEHRVPWSEFCQLGVVRGLKTRAKSWSERREKLMGKSPLLRPDPLGSTHWQRAKEVLHRSLGTQPLEGEKLIFCEQNPPSVMMRVSGPMLQTREGVSSYVPMVRGGQRQGEQILNTFFEESLVNYMNSLSPPLRAQSFGSHISAHLTWGCLSAREVHHRVREKRLRLGKGPSTQAKSLFEFEKRLWWRSHFVQKLETQPRIEFENMNRGFDLLPRGRGLESLSKERLQAFQEAQTGFPLVDASLLALKQCGWINFRMRAMLVSFACYNLWLDWREVSPILAKLFTDFEPGIHYSQMQMQSGVTGINAIRMYSIKKQTLDKDPDRGFVLKYLPQLKDWSLSDIADPEAIPPLLIDTLYANTNYPAPCVNFEESYHQAKVRVFDHLKLDVVKKESQTVLQTLSTTRFHRMFPKQKRPLS